MTKSLRVIVWLVAFILLATLNSGGYQYGVGDQAFYVPSILRHLDDSLFPRDTALIGSQDRLLLLDDVLAVLIRVTGLSLPTVFLALYGLATAMLGAAVVALGRHLYRSSWAIAALLLALTLRHRIARTGVNTLEGSFHPRMLAYAVGVGAVAAFLRGRVGGAAVLVAVSAAVHPTTAAFFAVWIGAALVLSHRGSRVSTAVLSVAGAVVAVALVLGPLSDRVAIMDEAWLSVLSTKDYLFPSEWPIEAWAINLAYPLVIGAVFVGRRRAGLVTRYEHALVIGSAALVALFALSVPLTALRLALAVQLQVPRVFWMLDLLATAYVVWALFESAAMRRRPRWRAAVLTIVAAASIGRGLYVLIVEHPERPIISRGLAASDWHEAMAWVASTSPDAHVLADPGHAWKYGTSVRVSGRRDVFLEEVKDAAIAMYSREVALRVAERIHAGGDFGALGPDRAAALAAKYDLHLLVTEDTFPFHLVYQNRRFRIYALR